MNPEIKNLVRKIQRQSAGKHDEVEPASTIKHQGQGFTFKGQHIRTTRIGTNQLCSIGGIPIRVFDKLSEEQKSATFNELFEKLGDRHFMFRFSENTLLGVVSPNYQRIDNNVMVDVIRRASSSLKLVPVKAVVSPEFSFIRMIPEGSSLSLHEFVPALTINNSEIGLSAFSIRSSLVVLRCMNGLIWEDKQQQWRWLHYGQNTDVRPDLSEIMNVANQSVRFLDNTRGRYLTVEEKIHYANMVKRDLGVKVANAFVQSVNTSEYSNGRDMYSLIGALTSVAPSFMPMKQFEVESFAGRLLKAA